MAFESQPSRIFCIGRNYTEHAQELKNEVPSQPVIFMKPASAIVPPGQPIVLPKHGKLLHQEAEVVVKIGYPGRATTPLNARSMISSLSLGLDLTLRDVQNELKAKGLPWEMAKAFDGSAPLGYFSPLTSKIDLANIEFSCDVNGQIRQVGNTSQMLFSIEQLIMGISTVWKLHPGDIIFTGTPAGVGPIELGDVVTVKSPLLGRFSWKVMA
jgi:2-keto-4-pentenoate hydratase/2-oxohepta-3-ene-1,7-dioic acid hydratase in catechol pathway